MFISMLTTVCFGDLWFNQSWALWVFLKFFITKKWFVFIFYQVNNLFLHQSYSKRPLHSQINLIKKRKKSFLLLKNFNTQSAQLWLNHKSPKHTVVGIEINHSLYELNPRFEVKLADIYIWHINNTTFKYWRVNLKSKLANFCFCTLGTSGLSR